MSLGNGTRFVRLNDDPTPALVDIAGAAIELGSFKIQREINDDTKFSNDSGYKDVAGGLLSVDPTTIKLEFDRAEAYHLDLMADLNSGVPRQFGLQWPDAAKTQMLCQGIVSEMEFLYESGSKLYYNVTVAWSGEPAWGNWS